MTSPLQRRRCLPGRCVATDSCPVASSHVYCAVTKQRTIPSVLHVTIQVAAFLWKEILAALMLEALTPQYYEEFIRKDLHVKVCAGI
jgi:hypothetical protein